MGKISFYLAMLAGKTASALLKLLGRNASYLPGKVALTICKDFMGRLTLPKTVICVTGTNGKTTVSTFRPVSARRCWMTPPLAGPSGKTLRCWKSTSAALC